MEEIVQISRDFSCSRIRAAWYAMMQEEKEPLQLLKCCLETGSVWVFVLITFPRTWAPSHLKYCFSKSGSIKFHLILKLKEFPMYSRGLLPSRNRITCVWLCCTVWYLCYFQTATGIVKTYFICWVLSNLHLMHSTPLFYICLTWTTERNSFHGGVRRFLKGLICI